MAEKRDCSVQTSPNEDLVTSPDSMKECVACDLSPVAISSVLSASKVSQSVVERIKREETTDSTTEVTSERLRDTLQGMDLEEDDGYYESHLSQPTTISQVDQALLHSGVALIPGCRDKNGRSVVYLFLGKLIKFLDSEECKGDVAAKLAEQLMYYYTVPEIETTRKGLVMILVSENFTKSSAETTAAWRSIDEALSLLETNIPRALHSVHYLSYPNETVMRLKQSIEVFPGHIVDLKVVLLSLKTKCEDLSKPEELFLLVDVDQLLPEIGGLYLYDHQEWISFRKFLEPFVTGCRLSGRRLVSVMEEMNESCALSSAALTSQVIEQQKRHIHHSYQDEQLRHLDEEGDTILNELESYKTRAPHNVDYRDSWEHSATLYGELRSAMSKLSKLAGRRLHKLEEYLHRKTLFEESSQVLSWLCRRGEESLLRHQSLAESFQGIKEQEEDFEKFYFLAMRQIEKGHDLLEESCLVVGSSTEDGATASDMISLSSATVDSDLKSTSSSVGMQDLTTSLRHHLNSFSDRLEDTREKLEDTAKCYHLLDKVYEWALDTMKFVSAMKLEVTSDEADIYSQIKSLEEYLDQNPPIPEEVFQEMIHVANRLNNSQLLEHCQTSHSRCSETVELVQARHATLVRGRHHRECTRRLGGTPTCPNNLQHNQGVSPLHGGWEPDIHSSSCFRSNRVSQPQAAFWPQVGSTPCSTNGFHQGHQTTFHPQSYVRRRSMSSISPPAGFSSPFASYTSFPSNASYGSPVSTSPTSISKNAIQLENYLRDKEEELQSQGLITEDLTTQGPVACISRDRVEARYLAANHPISAETPNELNTAQPTVPPLRSSAGSRLATKGGSPSPTSSTSALHPVMQRPVKKHMRICPTWQFCEEALQKAADTVRHQNERLRNSQECKDLPRDSNASITSEESLLGSSFPDQEDGSLISCHSSETSSNCGSSSCTPNPVNSHLLGNSVDETPTGINETDGTTQTSDEILRSKTTVTLIMRELIQTERDYVKSLEYIIEEYLPELLRDDIPQALRGQRNVIFGNIEKIFEFHSQYFLQELETCQLSSPFLIGQCFLQYERQFYLYALYNKNKPKSDILMSEYGTSFFRRKQLLLKDKMDLASYLLKPVQRMGKYALLIKQILKECSETEKETEHQDLRAAEEMVRFQLRHGNDLLAMDALRECDVNVKEQGRLLRQEEFLVWQGRYRNKSLRRVFLFEDLILLSKARRDPDNKGQEIYQYKNSIKTTDIGLTEQIGESPSKFEIWFRKRKLQDTYILQAPNPETKKSWSQEISRLLWKQALKNREIRLAEMSSMGIGNKPCLDIKPSEDQINDRSIRVNARGPRFRSSMALSSLDHLRGNNKRPHSIISVSSSSSSGSSNGNPFNFNGTLNLGFEPGDASHHHRSMTQQSQCSTESGFCTDSSLAGDLHADLSTLPSSSLRYKKAERSHSILSNDSVTTQPPDGVIDVLSLEEGDEIRCPPVGISEESVTTAM